MDKLLDNLLIVHETLSNAEDFVRIRHNIESLHHGRDYTKLVNDTDLLIKVLKAFASN